MSMLGFSISRLALVILGLACFQEAYFAQTQLLSANFNNCTLDAGWQVTIDGNQNADWYVGTPLNSNSDSISIDGSCMVIIDDDATGDNTAPYVWHLTSPVFDATAFTTVTLSADVHFRSNGDSASFAIEVWDGIQWNIIRYWINENFTGEQFSEAGQIEIDLSFHRSTEARIRFSYDDNAAFAWWAGVDNISVVGDGQGEILLSETFNACETPTGWSTYAYQGAFVWEFGIAQNGNLSPNQRSIDGTCMAFFDDDVIGGDVDPSTVVLYSPWVDLVGYAQVQLNLDYIFRRAVIDEHFAIYIDDGVQWQLVDVFTTDHGGPGFNESVQGIFDLSTLRSEQARLVFEYGDGGGFGWYAGIDNVKLIASGSINDRCVDAIELQPDVAPVAFDNRYAITQVDGDCADDMVGNLWFTFSAIGSGTTEIDLKTDYNDQVEVYRGSCGSLTPIRCHRRDEHGFEGELLFIETTSRSTYFIRVSGTEVPFGATRGSGIVALRQNQQAPLSPHQVCRNALQIDENDWTSSANNTGARQVELDTMEVLERHTQYLQFTAATSGAYEVLAKAAFSSNLRVYEGDCNALLELGATSTERLLLDNLNAGSTYTIELAGAFATLEGEWQIRVNPVTVDPPNPCATAEQLDYDIWTQVPDLSLANIPSIHSSCGRVGASSTFYSFATGSNETIYVKSRGDLGLIATIYDDCSLSTEVTCGNISDECENDLALEVEPNTTYFLQVSSSSTSITSGRVEVLISGQASSTPLLSGTSNIMCLGAGIGELAVAIAGGETPYTFTGTANGDLLMTGETATTIIVDNRGCDLELRSTSSCVVDLCGLAVEALVVPEACESANNGSIFLDVESGQVAIAWENGDTDLVRENLAPGTYTVTISLPDGCSAERQFVIRPATPIMVDADIQNVVNGINGSIHIDPSGGSGLYTYQWTKDGSAFAATEDIVDLSLGEYLLTIADENGCTLTAGPYVLDGISSTVEQGRDEVFSLAPNPANESVSIVGLTASAADLTLFDVRGVLVAKTSLAKGEQLNVSRLIPGVYQVRVATPGMQSVLRLVVAR